MKVVIELDSTDYMYIKNGCIVPIKIDNHIYDAIRGGTVLPEGHGRLIDADDLIQDIIDDNQLCIFNSESERIVHDEMVNFAIDRLADCSTIIEADKEIENEDSN